MKNINKKRLFLLIFASVSVLIISLLYNLVFKMTDGKAFECVFLTYVGIYCPGCGGSRSLNALLSFKFVRSFLLYPPILITSLMLLIYDIFLFFSIIRNDYLPMKRFGLKFVLIIPISIGITFILRTVLLFMGFDLISFALTLNF
jgi:hypothetical protein